jgi:PepSY-associated TM region
MAELKGAYPPARVEGGYEGYRSEARLPVAGRLQASGRPLKRPPNVRILPTMSFLTRCLRQPRKVLIRKIAFQIHLWIGIAIGLYIVVLSLTGSALVFRREMDRAFAPDRPVRDPARQVMSVEELTEAARRAYPDYTIATVGQIQRRTPVIQIDFTTPAGEPVEREFSAYTGEDLGDPFPASSEWLLWVVSLHDDLLIVRDQRGRFWNGVGSILATLLCITGAIVWSRSSANRRGSASTSTATARSASGFFRSSPSGPSRAFICRCPVPSWT